MSRNLILGSLIFLSTSAYADANDGEYLGYKLGEKFTAPRGAVGQDPYYGCDDLCRVPRSIASPHRLSKHLCVSEELDYW